MLRFIITSYLRGHVCKNDSPPMYIPNIYHECFFSNVLFLSTACKSNFRLRLSTKMSSVIIFMLFWENVFFILMLNHINPARTQMHRHSTRGLGVLSPPNHTFFSCLQIRNFALSRWKMTKNDEPLLSNLFISIITC